MPSIVHVSAQFIGDLAQFLGDLAQFLGDILTSLIWPDGATSYLLTNLGTTPSFDIHIVRTVHNKRPSCRVILARAEALRNTVWNKNRPRTGRARRASVLSLYFWHASPLQIGSSSKPPCHRVGI